MSPSRTSLKWHTLFVMVVVSSSLLSEFMGVEEQPHISARFFCDDARARTRVNLLSPVFGFGIS